MTERSGQAFEWVDVDDGVRRRILAETPEAMTVEVAFAQGASGAPHSHPHIQTTYVAAGVFEFTVDDKVQTVSTGQSIVIPSNAVHSCKAVESGALIDSFVPRRDDFL